jgi:DNA-binding response OmpR family regulator
MSLTMRGPCDHSRTARILVAVPDVQTRSRYRETLTAAGCDVVEASDGRDALVKALTHRPTVVVTDTYLPFVDGFALCDVLRRDVTTRTVPILVITRPTEADRARVARVNGVLIKPVPPDALLAEIERLIQARQPAPEGSPGTEPDGAAPQRQSLNKIHRRFATAHPPARPPKLPCPSCGRPLIYTHSHVGV